MLLKYTFWRDANYTKQGDLLLRKYIIWIMIAIVLASAVMAIDECQERMESVDIPCTVTTPYKLPGNCQDYQASLFNESGDHLFTAPLTSFGEIQYCQWTMNQTRLGTYYWNATTGDYGNILVEAKDMMLSLVIGIGIVAGLFLIIAFKVDESHFILKLLLIISAITMLLLIPLSTFMPDSIGVTFYRVFLYVFIAFWLYVITYFVYWLLDRMGIIVAGSKR